MKRLLCSIILQLAIIYQLYGLLNANPLYGDSIERENGNRLPFIVLIAKKFSSCEAQKHVCTGSLITKHHVLTDAKCLDFPSESIEVIAGSTDVSSPFHRKFNVASNITYKQWARRPGAAEKPELLDIGVLRLATFDTGIKPAAVTLYEKHHKPQATLRVIGWGQMPQLFCPQQPRIGSLRILDGEDCLNRVWMFEPDHKKNVESQELTCASSNHVLFGVDGDYGGPLINKENSIVGILYRRCPINEHCPAIPDLPNLVLRFTGFTRFISKIIADAALLQP